MNVYLLLAVVSSFSMVFHPLHISVCEIDHDTNRNALEITTRIFTDDLELQIRTEEGDEQIDIINGINNKDRNRLIEAYLKRHITIWLDGTETAFKYLGSEEENGAMYCYMEITGVEKLGKVGVKNSILIDVFRDQVNLVHVSQGDKIKSMKLEGIYIQDEIDF